MKHLQRELQTSLFNATVSVVYCTSAKFPVHRLMQLDALSRLRYVRSMLLQMELLVRIFVAFVPKVYLDISLGLVFCLARAHLDIYSGIIDYLTFVEEVYFYKDYVPVKFA